MVKNRLGEGVHLGLGRPDRRRNHLIDRRVLLRRPPLLRQEDRRSIDLVRWVEVDGESVKLLRLLLVLAVLVLVARLKQWLLVCRLRKRNRRRMMMDSRLWVRVVVVEVEFGGHGGHNSLVEDVRFVYFRRDIMT